ncbi:MAG: CopC domain, partial [Gammaproteobacteria bacterium]|nr:CopC domain [Gammaproteobacteria bacterium]
MLKQAMLIAALGGAMLTGQCLAHAKLQSSSPANAAQLTEPPKTLTLTFNEPAQVAA